jgi:hypothetical protein
MSCPTCPHEPHDGWCASCNCYAHTVFDPPHAHRDDIETSHYAAETNTTSQTHQLMILRAHADALRGEPGYRGFTDEESGIRTGLETVEARRRCNNLRNMGYLMFTEETRPGVQYPTKPNQVSIITAAGQLALGRQPIPTVVGVAQAEWADAEQAELW